MLKKEFNVRLGSTDCYFLVFNEEMAEFLIEHRDTLSRTFTLAQFKQSSPREYQTIIKMLKDVGFQTPKFL